jgi:hypothetical protein
MEDHRFDDLSRAAGTITGSPRRAVLAAAAGSLFTVLPAAWRGDGVAAKKKGKKKRKKKRAQTVTFAANPLTGTQEVAPTIGDPRGVGHASFTITGDRICGTFTLTQATSFTVTGTHIHQGAAGVNGAIVVDFSAYALGVQTCLNCPSSACSGDVLRQIKANPAGFYANIHTTPHPDGAVRGQLQRV